MDWRELKARVTGSYVGVMDVRAALDELVAAASLPPVASTRVLRERGFDNQLLVGVLADGRQVQLRQSTAAAPPPIARARFLSVHDVGAPRLYAASDAGAVLVGACPATRASSAGGSAFSYQQTYAVNRRICWTARRAGSGPVYRERGWGPEATVRW